MWNLRNPMDCSLPGSSVHGISQASIRSRLPFPPPQDLPDLGIKLASPVSPGISLTPGGCETRVSWEGLSGCLWPAGFQFPSLALLVTGAERKCLKPKIFVRVYCVLSEKAMAPHSSTLAWKIPWTEEPGRLQSMGSRRVGHN